ncbi:MAG: outer membrane protein transport protein [candidate division Zixibacteria bacterium]|nr:outer membrane protein transport protein [candidate division Zixibacteria bacterium]MCI0596612.1 outer membrane protein transport protein [candidate division Zixibacteria bacterium]
MRKVYGFLVFLGLAFLQWSSAGAQGSIVFPSNVLGFDLLPYQLPGLDLNFSPGGAAARGMGGAFTAVSGNLSAIGINPAGLASLNRPQTSLVYRYNRPSVRSRQFGSAIGLDHNDINSFDQIDFGAIAVPGKLFGRDFVGAVAYNVFADQFFSDQASYLGIVRVDTLYQTAPQNFSRQTSGKLAGFNLGAATRVGPLSLGAGFVIYQGGFSDTTDLLVGPFFVKPASGQDSGYILPAFDKQRLANKVDYRGSSLTLGAQFEYKKARLGLAARVPAFTLGETDLFRLKSNMDIGFYDSVFVSGLFQVGQSQLSNLFFTDSRLELPLSVTSGLSYLFGRSLLVDFDYTYTNWGAADLKVHRIFQSQQSNLATLELGSAPVGLTSTHQVRLGWELELNPGFGQLFIRGGLRNLPGRTLPSVIPNYALFFQRNPDTVLVDSSFGPLWNDVYITDAQGNIIDTVSTATLAYGYGAEDRNSAGKIWQQFGASLGLGVRWNQVGVDLAYDYTTFRQNSRTLTPFQGEQLTHSRQQRRHRLFVSFTGYFTRL